MGSNAKKVTVKEKERAAQAEHAFFEAEKNGDGVQDAPPARLPGVPASKKVKP